MKNLLLYIIGYSLIVILQSCGLPDPTFKTEKDEGFEIIEEDQVSKNTIELQNYIDSLDAEKVPKAQFTALVSAKKEEIDSRQEEPSSSSKKQISSSSSSSFSSSTVGSSSSINTVTVSLVDISTEEFIMAPGSYRVLFVNHSLSDAWRNLFCKANVEENFSMSYNGVSYYGWLLQIVLSDDKGEIAEFEILDHGVTCYSLSSSRSKSVILK